MSAFISEVRQLLGEIRDDWPEYRAAVFLGVITALLITAVIVPIAVTVRALR